MRGHRHYAHAIGQASIDGLQALVVERFSEQDRCEGFNHLRVGDGAVGFFVRGDAGPGVFSLFAAEAKDKVRDGETEGCVLFWIACLERFQEGNTVLFEVAGLGYEAICLRVEDGAHVSLSDGSDGAEHALLAAARASAVAGDQRVVVAAHHEHVAQRCGLRVRWIGCVEQAEVLLRCVGQQVEEGGAGFVFGVDFGGFLHHLERHVIAASGDAGRAAFAEIADEDGEDAAGAGGLALGRREDGVDLLIGHRHLVDDRVELRLCFGREAIDRLGDFANDLRQRRAGLHFSDHALAGLLLDFRKLRHHLRALAGVAHVAGYGHGEHRAQILRGVGQRGVGADRDALHALGAVLRDVERGFATGYIL